MEKAGAALAGMHLGIREFIRPGMSSWKIEEFARKYFKAAGAKAEQIGFEGYLCQRQRRDLPRLPA